MWFISMVAPGVPVLTTASASPAAARRSPSERRSSSSPAAAAARRSSCRAVWKARSGTTERWKNWLATTPCAPGGQPVTRLEMQTRGLAGEHAAACREVGARRR